MMLRERMVRAVARREVGRLSLFTWKLVPRHLHLPLHTPRLPTAQLQCPSNIHTYVPYH